jgi:hypothetical protein
MPTRVHTPLKITAVNANGIGRQAYEVRQLLQNLGKDVALFTASYRKPHMRFCSLDYDIYRTDHEDGHEGGTANTVTKGIHHTCADPPPLLPVKATGVCIPIGNTDLLLAGVYKSPQKL